MTSKFNISFAVDLTEILPNHQGTFTAEMAEALLTEMLVNPARHNARNTIKEIQALNLDSDVKAIKMGEQLRSIMFGIMAQANVQVTELDDCYPVETQMPFEASKGSKAA